MATVIRYFSTTGAGTEDGTTWADRAALFSSGNWSTIITGFNFSLGDMLECRVGPGTYACGQQLQSSLFANPPTLSNILLLIAADSSGDILSNQNPGWTPAVPLDTTAFPRIEQGNNTGTINYATGLVRVYQFSIYHTGRNGSAFDCLSAYCRIENATSNTSAIATNTVSDFNEYVCSGTSYSAVVSSAALNSVRAYGNPEATSGNRRVWSASINAVGRNVCLIGGLNNVFNSNSTGSTAQLYGFVAVGAAGTAITRATPSASTTAVIPYENGIIANAGGWGVDLENAFDTYYKLLNVRARNNTSGNFRFSINSLVREVDESSGSDAAEFVNAASGDYRIKYGSALWGRNLGCGDEPAPSGGGVRIPNIRGGADQ